MAHSPPVELILVLLILAGQASSGDFTDEASGSKEIVLAERKLVFEETELCNKKEERFLIDEPIQSVAGDSMFEIAFTTLNEVLVTYRPTELGLTEGVVSVETATQLIRYSVSGTATPNYYGLLPITAIIPKGSIYTKRLSLHNPHPSHSLTIVSCTTESQFILLNNTSPESWSLSPHQQSVFATVSIMPIFTGSPEGIVTVGILKRPIADSVENAEEEEIIEIEVPVSYDYATDGLYPVRKVIDFGTLIDAGKVFSKDIVMLNTFSNSEVTIQSVTWTDDNPTEDDEKSVELVTSSHATTIPTGSSLSVATLLFTASYTGRYSGQVTVDYSTPGNPVQSASVPFRARVLFGSITYNSNATIFMCSIQGDSLKRAKPAHLFLTNNFNVPVKVTGASISSVYFTITGTVNKEVIMPGGQLLVATIKYLPTNPIFVAGNLTIQTNLTQVKIPLQSYHGKLTLSTGVMNKQELSALALKAFAKPVVNLGMVSVPSMESVRIDLRNPNPIPVNIVSISEGVFAKVVPALQRSNKILQPEQTLTLNVTVNVTTEGVSKDKLIIVTPFQVMEVIVTCLGVHGHSTFINHETNSEITQSNPLIINNVLLASSGEAPIFVKSTHQEPMLIDNISISDPRITVELASSLVVVPGAFTDIGKVIVSPIESDRRVKKEKSPPAFRRRSLSNEDIDQYKSVQLANSVAGQSISAVINVIITDATLLFQKTLRLYVTSVPEKAEFVEDTSIDFGRITVGSTAERFVKISNPSKTDLHIQIIKWGDIPIPLLSALQACLNTSADPSLHEAEFSIAPHALKKTVLSPGEVLSLGPIYYKATKLEEVSTTFIIRNSLSGIETLNVKGSGGKGNLLLKTPTGDSTTMEIRPGKSSFAKWGSTNRQRGDFISFWSIMKLGLHGLSWLNTSYIVPQHFQDSAPVAVSEYTSDPVSFNKVFTIVNNGNHHINITSAMLTANGEASVLSGDGCDSVRGIALRDCGRQHVQMFLPPDGQGSIAFKFSPDFTSDTVRAVLHLVTDEGLTFNFNVVGFLPRDLLLLHYDTLPHTLSETFFRAITMLFLLSLGVLLAAHVVSVEFFDKEPTSIVDLSVFVLAKNSILSRVAGLTQSNQMYGEKQHIKKEVIEEVVDKPLSPPHSEIRPRDEIALKDECSLLESSTPLQTTPEEYSPASSQEASPTSDSSICQLTEQALSKKSDTTVPSEVRSLTPTSERILDGSSLSITNASIASSSKGEATAAKEKPPPETTKAVKRATKERDRELKREKQRLADEKRRRQLQEKVRFEEEERLQAASERAAALKLQQEKEEEKRRAKLQREEDIRKETEKKLQLQKQKEKEKREREEREKEDRRKAAERAAEKEAIERQKRERAERERRERAQEKAIRLKAEAEAREKNAVLAAAEREQKAAQQRDLDLWQLHQKQLKEELKPSHSTPTDSLSLQPQASYEETFQPLGISHPVRQSDGDFWVSRQQQQQQQQPVPQQQQQQQHFVCSTQQQQNVLQSTQQITRQFQQSGGTFTAITTQQQSIQNNSWPVQGGHKHHQQQQQQHLLKQVMQQHSHQRQQQQQQQQQHHTRQAVLTQPTPPPLVSAQPSGFSLFQGGGGSADFVNDLRTAATSVQQYQAAPPVQQQPAATPDPWGPSKASSSAWGDGWGPASTGNSLFSTPFIDEALTAHQKSSSKKEDSLSLFDDMFKDTKDEPATVDEDEVPLSLDFVNDIVCSE
eukprot:TRINITY_DN1968_c1_g1_i3.p1 TRINITY_DN1968_c1_g1~~TRINITY_DN1968_c1_g1_i3.p1  ORF type:complete len:1722 (+),score=355.26 TRINITY_DN1968_c1_g1_i3:41-5206(+)